MHPPKVLPTPSKYPGEEGTQREVYLSLFSPHTTLRQWGKERRVRVYILLFIYDELEDQEADPTRGAVL